MGRASYFIHCEKMNIICFRPLILDHTIISYLIKITNPQHILVKWWSEGTIHGLLLTITTIVRLSQAHLPCVRFRFQIGVIIISFTLSFSIIYPSIIKSTSVRPRCEIFFFRNIRVENVILENFLTPVWSGNASTAQHHALPEVTVHFSPLDVHLALLTDSCFFFLPLFPLTVLCKTLPAIISYRLNL